MAMTHPLTVQRYADLGLLIRRVRKTASTSVETCAAAASVGPATWRRIESGHPARAATYRAIESLFGWPAGTLDAFLATGTPPPPPDLSQLQGGPAANGLRFRRIDVGAVLAFDAPDSVKVRFLEVVRDDGEPLRHLGRILTLRGVKDAEALLMVRMWWAAFGLAHVVEEAGR